MTGPADKRSASGRLRGLLEVTRLVRSGADVDTLLNAVARTSAESVEKLRQWAVGRCLSADRAGIYEAAAASGSRRKVSRGRIDPSQN